MDKRRNLYLGLDTETCNGMKNDLSQSLCYDIGWAIVDRKSNVYKKRSFVVLETFFGMTDLMQSAYYAEKIPRYIWDINHNLREVASIKEIYYALREDCQEYNIKAIFAHNARFDVNALNNTIRYITKSEKRFFLPYGIPIWDTMKMAQDVIATQKTYQRFCIDNGYMTNHAEPRPRITAEVLYKYIAGQHNFIESHTGLEDVLIEQEIFSHCWRQHKPMRKSVWGD